MTQNKFYIDCRFKIMKQQTKYAGKFEDKVTSTKVQWGKNVDITMMEIVTYEINDLYVVC